MPLPRLASMVSGHVNGRFRKLCSKSNLDDCLVDIFDIKFVLLLFVTDKFGLIATVGDGGQHRIGNMPDPTQFCGLQKPDRREISTPIPPIMMGTSSCLPKRRRKSSYTFHYGSF